MKPARMVLILLMMTLRVCAEPAAQIIAQKGRVLVRHGMSESWLPAATGMMLDAFDTILTAEAGEVLLQAPDGSRLRIGANIILDISDIKRLSEREMLLWLVSQKIDQLPKRQEGTPLRFGQITSVHGDSKNTTETPVQERPQRWRAEVNGALTLLENDYYTNTVVKCHKILRRYPEQNDCGEIHYYLGRALEAIHHNGQALEAYQTALNRLSAEGCEGTSRSNRHGEIASALKRLKQTAPAK